jgi:hypothetical protein
MLVSVEFGMVQLTEALLGITEIATATSKLLEEGVPTIRSCLTDQLVVLELRREVGWGRKKCKTQKTKTNQKTKKTNKVQPSEKPTDS